jgi:CRISPR-associated protein Cmr5
MQTRDQKYAVDVYERVSKVKEADRKRYGAIAHKLPILIRTAGLVQALAFVDSRQKQLLNDLAGTIGKPNSDTLLSRAREANLSEYMRLTQQVMAALLWYKRFAQSVLGVNASDAEDEA